MQAKTMEGLMGAGINKELARTPMRVFKEARRKGDTETMERAMGYVNDCEKRAEEYQVKTEEGMKEDAKEARRAEKAAREEAIEKRKEEREESEKRLEAAKEGGGVTLEISEAGKALAKDGTVSDVKAETAETAGTEGGGAEAVSIETPKTDGAKAPGLYTGTGEMARSETGGSISVSV